MKSTQLLFSIKPHYAELILAGKKTIELRKFRPELAKGDPAFLYATYPQQKLVGYFLVDKVVTESPILLWKKYGLQSSVSKSDYDAYFANCRFAHGVLVQSAHRFEEGLTLRQIRQIEPDFRPPQGFMYLEPPRKLAMYLDLFRHISKGIETAS